MLPGANEERVRKEVDWLIMPKKVVPRLSMRLLTSLRPVAELPRSKTIRRVCRAGERGMAGEKRGKSVTGSTLTRRTVDWTKTRVESRDHPLVKPS
jgi:hypothetical protein